MPSDNYTLERRADGTVVSMLDHVPFPPTSEERDELLALIRDTEVIIVDLSATKSLATLWLRLFAELTEKAEVATRHFRLASVNQAILKTRDYIGLAGHLRVYASVAAAKQP